MQEQPLALAARLHLASAQLNSLGVRAALLAARVWLAVEAVPLVLAVRVEMAVLVPQLVAQVMAAAVAALGIVTLKVESEALELLPLEGAGDAVVKTKYLEGLALQHLLTL